MMVTCYLRYIVDPPKLAELETNARMWIALVGKFRRCYQQTQCFLSYQRSFFRPVFS